MKYPQEFVVAVKTAYPEWGQLHRALDKGSELVGLYLDDSRIRFTPLDILQAATFEELQEEARKAQVRDALYAQWLIIYRQEQAQQ